MNTKAIFQRILKTGVVSEQKVCNMHKYDPIITAWYLVWWNHGLSLNMTKTLMIINGYFFIDTDIRSILHCLNQCSIYEQLTSNYIKLKQQGIEIIGIRILATVLTGYEIFGMGGITYKKKLWMQVLIHVLI